MFKCLSLLLAMWMAAPVAALEAGGSADAARQQVETLVTEGKAHLAKDRFDAARAALMEARALLPASADPTLEISTLLALAEIDLKQGTYDRAGALLDEAEALWRQNRDPALGARLWTARAGIAFRQLRNEDALQHRLRAVEQARMTDDPALLFQTLTNLARAHLDLHNYAAAIPLFVETARLEGRPLDQVVNRIQLGISQFELNQFDAARETFAAAREAARELGSPRLEGTALGELGLVAWNHEQDAAEAQAYFDQAIEIMDTIGDPVNAVAWRTNRAMVLRETGRFEEALALYRELESELERIEGQQVWTTIYKGIGQSELALGRLNAARKTIDHCLAVARLRGDSERIWECEQLKGRLNAKAGDFQAAREAYERALTEIERVRVSLLIGRFKADFFEDKLEVFQEYAAMLAEFLPAQDAARETFEVSERARARAFLDQLAQTKVVPPDRVPEDLLQREEALLQALRELRAENGTDVANADEITRLESELDSLALMARRQLALPADHSRPNSLAEIQDAMAADEVMLVYWLADSTSQLWRIDRQGIERRELPAAAEIEEMIRAAYAVLTDPGSVPDLVALSQTLLGPSAELGASYRSMLIVPSGILYYFPFEVLPLGDRALVSDQISTSYLPSASTLVHLRRLQPRRGPPALLALGDVPYPTSGAGTRPAMPGDFGPLPFSGPEVQAVRSRFGYGATNLLTGDAVDEGRVKAMPLDAYSVLHFATHGWIDPASYSASGLVLTARGDADDGLLQMREISDFELDAEMVVMSACQSAVGRLVTGEGMVGLTRSFLDAGARSVVASLWNVNDQASAEFMDAFYARLRQDMGRAQALREARAELRARPGYGHPYYWAAWVLTGEGRGGVEFPIRWERWAVLALGLLLLITVVAWRRVQSRS